MKGPIPDRIRAALDKPVKLGAKGEKMTFDKALEVFRKEAGLDVPVRGTFPCGRRRPKNPTSSGPSDRDRVGGRGIAGRGVVPDVRGHAVSARSGTRRSGFTSASTACSSPEQIRPAGCPDTHRVLEAQAGPAKKTRPEPKPK